MLKAIQILEQFATYADAEEALESMKNQEGFLGGRILPMGDKNPLPTLQAFQELEPGVDPNGWLPDGMRVVLVPDSLVQRLNLMLDAKD